MRVFWPTNIRPTEGKRTAFGWQLGEGERATLIVVDVVEEAVDLRDDKLGPTLERLASVLPPSTPSSSSPSSSADLTIWADTTPLAYSHPVETVLFAPSGALSLPLPPSDGKPAEYGARHPPHADPRALLERVNAVALAQGRLRGSTPDTSMWALRATSLVPWMLLGAELAYFALLDGVTSAVLCTGAVGALLVSGRALSPPRRSAFLRNIGRLRLPPPMSSAFVHQLAQRAGTTADLGEKASEIKVEIAHYASMAAITMDMLLGALASVLLLRLHIPPLPTGLADALTAPIIAALRWLDDWPFGLKLNTGLSAFLCGSIARVLELWRDAAAPALACALPHVPTAVALVCPLGASFGVALLSDILSLLTLHLRLISLVTAVLCRVSMTALLGLWDLFRGRRWNVLRHRTDSHAFDVDTLFLGTLLFTVTAFLAPTVLAYGLLFTLINFAIFIVQRTLALSIAGINCSVGFQLMASIPPHRGIPDGIVFDVVPPRPPHRNRAGDWAYPVQHALVLKSTTMGVGALLRQWWHDTVLTAR